MNFRSPFFKEDILELGLRNDSCIPVTARQFMDENTGHLDISAWRHYDEINNNQENTNSFENWARKVPNCDNEFFKSSDGSGCCFLPDAPNNDITQLRCKDEDNMPNSDHWTGISFLGLSDPFRDGTKPIGTDLSAGKICLKNNIKNELGFFDEPNKIINFFKLVMFSMISLIVTALIGTVYEFWLRYGDSIDCIYYTSNCNNIGKNNKINLLDYFLQKNICYYPYQRCNKNQSGGKKFVGGGIMTNFPEYDGTGKKCITMHFDEKEEYNKKPFPYYLPDDIPDNNLFAKTITKIFAYCILFTLINTRYYMNYLLSSASRWWQKWCVAGSSSTFLGGFFFLLLTGIWAPIWLALTGGNLNDANIGYWGPSWPLDLLCGIIGILSFVLMFFVFVGFFSLALSKKGEEPFYFAKAWLQYNNMKNCNDEIYNYEIIRNWCAFPYNSMQKSLSKDNWKDKNVLQQLMTSLYELFAFIFKFLIFLFLTIIFLLFFYILGMLLIPYQIGSFIWNFITIPLSNPLECLNIIKSHADLLTIIFLMGIAGITLATLSRNVAITMSILTVILICYKLFQSFKI